MKYFFYSLFLFISFYSFPQATKNSSLIKDVVTYFETKNLNETKAFVISSDYFLKDSSGKQGDSYILAYKKNATGEAIGMSVKKDKIEMISYVVTNKEEYDKVKEEILKSGFKADKPYQSEKEGIFEELGYQKNNTMIIASYRKNKRGLDPQYDFTVTKAF